MRSFESADIDLIQYPNGELMKDESNFWRRSLVETGGSAVVLPRVRGFRGGNHGRFSGSST
jgi:hypothetical protein